MSYYVILCHIMSYYVILCHIMSYHVILCHIMSSFFLLQIYKLSLGSSCSTSCTDFLVEDVPRSRAEGSAKLKVQIREEHEEQKLGFFSGREPQKR